MADKYIDPRSRAEQSKADSFFRSESARDLFTSMYKRRGLYWTVFLVFAAAFYFGINQLPRTYTARAVVRFDSRLELTQTENLENVEMSKYRPMTALDVNAEIQLFNAREIRQIVASDPEVYVDPPYPDMPLWDQKSVEEKQRAWRNYLYQGFSFEGVPNTNTAIITFQDRFAERSAELVNRLGKAFVTHRMSQQGDVVEIEALKAALDNAKAAYDEASERLDAFRTENGISTNTVDNLSDRLQESRSMVELRATEGEGKLASLQARYDALSQIDRSNIDALKGLPELASNPHIQSLEENKRGLLLRLNRERLYSTEAFDKVKLLQKEYDDAVALHDAAVLSAFDAIIFNLETSISERRAEAGSLRGRQAEIQAEIDRLAEVNTEFDRNLVDYTSRREAYQLAQKRFNAATSGGADLPEVKVSLAASAGVPPEPTLPPPVWLTSILAIVLGLFLAISSVFLAGYFDRTLDTPGEAERELGLPVLATIQNERGRRRKRPRA